MYPVHSSTALQVGLDFIQSPGRPTDALCPACNARRDLFRELSAGSWENGSPRASVIRTGACKKFAGNRRENERTGGKGIDTVKMSRDFRRCRRGEAQRPGVGPTVPVAIVRQLPAWNRM